MNLSEMLQSDGYIVWYEGMINNLATDDPERYERCEIASKDGSDGSFHAEVINDWIYFLEFHSLDIGISEIEHHKIYVEMLECWDLHDHWGSLYDEVG